MKSIKVKDIIEWANLEGFDFEYYGDDDIEIKGFSSLKKYKADSITWINLKNPVDEAILQVIKCAIIQKGVDVHPQRYFVSEESKSFFFAILEHFFSNHAHGITERKNTYIGESVRLGENVRIGCNCVLDGDIYIGDNTIIEHNVVMLNKVSIGSDCIIHPGTVIGKDGFGYSFDKNNIPKKVHHFGGVQIGNRVEIGCNCVVDRGTIDDTIIHDDVKIDNLVLIAHNVEIGEGTLVIGCTDVAGSARIGKKSYIGPQVCIKNQASVGDNSFIGMDVMVNEHIGDDIMVVKASNTRRFKSLDYRRFL